MVSDKGYILRKNGKTPLKAYIDNKGYRRVRIMVDGTVRNVSEHRIVATMFCDGYKPGLCVNHKDGNKQNNSSDNLEWVTPSENSKHAIYVLGKNKYRPNSVCVSCYDKETMELVRTFYSMAEAVRFFKTSYSCIKRALRNATLLHGYYWRYDSINHQ